MATAEEEIELKHKERNKKFFDRDLPHSKIKRKILKYNLKV